MRLAALRLQPLEASARPLVQGAAALLWSAKPSATYSEVKAALFNNADIVAALSGKVQYGRMNVARALHSLLGLPAPTLPNYSCEQAQAAQLCPLRLGCACMHVAAVLRDLSLPNTRPAPSPHLCCSRAKGGNELALSAWSHQLGRLQPDLEGQGFVPVRVSRRGQAARGRGRCPACGLSLRCEAWHPLARDGADPSHPALTSAQLLLCSCWGTSWCYFAVAVNGWGT